MVLGMIQYPAHARLRPLCAVEPQSSLVEDAIPDCNPRASRFEDRRAFGRSRAGQELGSWTEWVQEDSKKLYTNYEVNGSV